MIYDLMSLAERVAELKARLKACSPSDLKTILEIQREIVWLCEQLEEKKEK